MKKKIIILVSLFIILVVVFAPVKLVDNFIPKNNRLVISGMQGSLWSGEIGNVEIMGWRLENIDYNLSFLSLITGNIGGRVDIARGDIKGDFLFEVEDQQNLEIDDLNIETSAVNLEKYIPIKGVELGGKVLTRDFYAQLVNQKPIALSGMTSWSNASLNLNGQEWKLGSFDVIWSTDLEKNIITGKLAKNKKNEIDIDGEISLSKNGLLEFKGSISQSIDKTIYAAFSLFANGSAKNGRLPIKFKKKVI